MTKQYEITLRITERQVQELATEANRLAQERGEAYPELCSTALAIWVQSRPPAQRRALIARMTAETL